MTLSRRQALAALGLVLLGCRREALLPAACTDTTGLSAEQRQVRTTLAYVDSATEPGKDCERCQHYVAATQEGSCGGCKLLPGPVHPRGYCKVFTARG